MTRLRDRVGLNIPPLFLRLMLGLIFVFAGLGKVSVSTPVQGEEAAVLANMGVIAPPPGAVKPVVPPAAPTGSGGGAGTTGSTGPAAPAKPEPAAKSSETPGTTGGTGGPVSEPDKAAVPKPAAAKTSPSKPKPRTDAGAGRVVLARQAVPAKAYTAADFPQPVSVLTVYRLAAGLYMAAHPGVDEKGAPKMALWMQSLGDGRWPVYVAWTVALTELIGGAALLLGLFTRIMALGVAGVMVGALWLTVIGPSMQAGQTRLWFLPDWGMMDPRWAMPELQLALLMAALALAFCGPGRLSLDRAILGGGADGGDDDDDE